MNAARPTRKDWENALSHLGWWDGESCADLPDEYLLWARQNTHHHEYSELVVGITGENPYSIKEKSVRLTPGTIVLFPRHTPHDAWYWDKAGKSTDFWLHFLPHGAFTLNFVHHSDEHGVQGDALPPPPSPLKDDFHRAVQMINRSGSPLQLRKAHHFILYLLHELFEVLMETDVSKADGRSIVEEVKRYASDHLTDRLTLNDLAKAAGYSPFHFHRIFVEIEGMTPRAFVEAARLRNACELMRKGFSITSAALDSGFTTPSQFTTVFKKRFEIAPSEWIATQP